MTTAQQQYRGKKCRSWRDIFAVIWSSHRDTKILVFSGDTMESGGGRGNASFKARHTWTWIKFSKNFIRISLKISVLNFKLQRTYDWLYYPSCLRNSLKISGSEYWTAHNNSRNGWTQMDTRPSRLSEQAPYWEKVWVNIYPEKSRDWLCSSAQGFPSMGPGDTGSDRRVCFPNLIWPCQIHPVPGPRTFSLLSSSFLSEVPSQASSQSLLAACWLFCPPLQITKNNTELM